MILAGLVQKIEERLEYEKRARVCLWFDEKREFRRLLPGVERCLAARPGGRRLDLLVYDPTQGHGQLWIKGEVVRRGQDPQRKLLIYLPLSEDRLDGPDDAGRDHLELFQEYRYAGITWRIQGKRPTLFGFLRSLGSLGLPESQAEQRRLWDGGEHSVLARYVARFSEEPAAFWATPLTVEVARVRLLGDVEARILELAADPPSALAELRAQGLDVDFETAVAGLFGYAGPLRSGEDWVRGLVETLALGETYAAYREPADFPFHHRMALPKQREAQAKLVERWLRDAEGRASWDRWVKEAEGGIDLRSWAQGREGSPRAFPHLVRDRWERTYAAFETAAARVSTTESFFATHASRLEDELGYERAAVGTQGRWRVLHDLGQLLRAAADAVGTAPRLDAPAELVAKYRDWATRVDGAHRSLRQRAEELELEAVATVADAAYAEYLDACNARLMAMLVETGSAELPGLPHVTETLRRSLWRAKGRRAVVIVDALRVDCAAELADALAPARSELELLGGSLPSVTAVGMTALLPIDPGEIELTLADGELRPRHKGRDLSQRSQRITVLREQGADCREIDEVERQAVAPDRLGELLVVFGHEEVDSLGHGGEGGLIRHVEQEIARLARLVRRLHRWGYPVVHVVTDHGFLIRPHGAGGDLPVEKGRFLLSKERFGFAAPGEAPEGFPVLPSPWRAPAELVLAPGLSLLKGSNRFVHGGASLQEWILPHLVVHGPGAGAAPAVVTVELPETTITRGVVKVRLRAAAPPGQPGTLFATARRRVEVDVRVEAGPGAGSSGLERGPQLAELDVRDHPEETRTLFLRSSLRLPRGATLKVRATDADTGEDLAAMVPLITVGRDL